MTTDRSASTVGGPPETVLRPGPDDARAALERALAEPTSTVAATRCPTSSPAGRAFLDAWAQLGELARDDVEAYAYFRVGYHRGLDQLRQSGWRGSGYVRWRHETNRGFLARARRAAAARPPRSARPTRPSGAPSSCASSTPGWHRLPG